MLCGACISVLQHRQGFFGDDLKDGLPQLLTVVGDRPKPSSSHATNLPCPDAPDVFRHHKTARDLQNSAFAGCYICRRIWKWIDAVAQQELLEADSRAPGPYLTYIQLVDEKFLSLLGLAELGTDFQLKDRLLTVGLRDDLSSIVRFNTRDVLSFGISVSQNAVPYDTSSRLSTETGSLEALSFAMERFRDCLANHEECKASGPKKWFPSRLICLDDTHDRQKIRLVLSDEIVPDTYATLSHCWGSAEFFKLSRTNYDDFRRGKSVSEFPKTFRDSFYVADQLSIRYIWIDSLCIIQDDPNDWLREAKQMHLVYANSLCNICATGVRDSSEGLFVSRDLEVFESCDVDIPWLDGGGRFRILDKSLWMREVLKSPLNMRAWVVQEHFLAPRHLHFGASQIFWECLANTSCEQYPRGMPPEIAHTSSIVRRLLHAPPSKLNTMERSAIFRSWTSSVKAYMDAKLTYQKDKSVAFSGIVKRFEDILDDECVAGLWRKTLENDLLWHIKYCRQTDGSPSARPDTYRAPSFSWMSIDGQIESSRISEQDHLLARVLSAEIEQTHGLITGGTIVIQCTLKPLYLFWKARPPNDLIWLVNFFHDNKETGWSQWLEVYKYGLAYALMDVDQDYDGIYYGIPIKTGFSGLQQIGGLVLQETGKRQGEFKRVGVFVTSEKARIFFDTPQDGEEAYPCENYDATEKQHTISVV